MFRIYRRFSLVMTLLLMLPQAAWAAPPLAVVAGQQIVEAKIPQAVLQNIRYSQSPQKVRIVLDVSILPAFTDNLTENPDQLVVDFKGTVNKLSARQKIFDDPVLNSLELTEVEPGKQRVVIDLKRPATYKVFTLTNPNRIVIDIIKDYDQKSEVEVAPGVKYTSLLRYKQTGPISAHIIDIAPEADYMIKTVLSNDAITGLERLQSMAERSKAIAAVNASYFALSGEILGLLKIDGEIVSTSDLDRTAFGLMPDGKIMIDQIDYLGSITLPDGRAVAITGVNHERGTNDLILYNNYYDSMTGTNEFGSDYIINNGKITAIAHGNAAIPPGGVVLSAHGIMEKTLVGLKVGDKIKITQTLGEKWDKTIDAISAGPRLVKNGSVFLTSKEEDFPSDITSGRAPRTAIGTTKDGHVILLVVDGRQQSSVGMTLLELALLMQEYGAVDAMNLDGGGSSEMVVGGKVVNNPSDGRERSVGNALIIVPKK
ncbi:MAG: Protein of unknown function periplasmic [Firmicutes bacterium]|nr:Protein of unknown function periplasmic [Bacillota bacterium]